MSDKKANEPGFQLAFDFDVLSAIEYAEFIDASREFGQNARRAVKTISETLAKCVTGGVPDVWGPADDPQTWMKLPFRTTFSDVLKQLNEAASADSKN